MSLPVVEGSTEVLPRSGSTVRAGNSARSREGKMFSAAYQLVFLWVLVHSNVFAQTTQSATSAASQPSSSSVSASPSNLPLMIPFDPAEPNSFQLIELPAPSPAIQTPSQEKQAALPAITNRPASSDSISPGVVLPGASQLLPRNTTQSARPFEVSGISQLGSGEFPPIPDLAALDLNQPQPSGNSAGLPTANRPSSMGSLVSFQSSQGSLAETVTTDFEASHLVAIVGTERILAGDLAAMVEPIIHENRARITNKVQEQEVRQSLTRQALPQYVELKALSQEFFRDMAGNVPPNEIRKMREQVTTRASRMFYERYVPMDLYKRYKVEDLAELDQKLRETNLSLAFMKDFFLTQALAAQLEEKYVSDNYEIPPQEILDYYFQNIERWQIPARAKWRQLTVLLNRHNTEADAEKKIMQMGNEVVLGGKSFEAVARDSSDGFTAPKGGNHDWTFEGSLKSSELDKAIFSLPLNRLSNIIRDDMGFHIIEVLQREAARTKDMAEIQTEIRKTLSKKLRQQKAEEFRERVLGRVIVWTRWPEDIPGSRPLVEALGETVP